MKKILKPADNVPGFDGPRSRDTNILICGFNTHTQCCKAGMVLLAISQARKTDLERGHIMATQALAAARVVDFYESHYTGMMIGQRW